MILLLLPDTQTHFFKITCIHEETAVSSEPNCDDRGFTAKSLGQVKLDLGFQCTCMQTSTHLHTKPIYMSLFLFGSHTPIHSNTTVWPIDTQTQTLHTHRHTHTRASLLLILSSSVFFYLSSLVLFISGVCEQRQ